MRQRRLSSPVLPDTPGRAVISGARFAVFFTAAAWCAYLVEQLVRLSNTGVTVRSLAETSVYLLLVTLLTGSAMAYLLARVGFYERSAAHRRTPRSTIDDFFEETAPTMTVIVPSYREDERVIRQTLLSAALQEYPALRVVLLVDDPPHPKDAAARQALERARALPAELTQALRSPRGRFEAALKAFVDEKGNETWASPQVLETLAGHYRDAAAWFESEKRTLPRHDHSDEFLAVEFFDRMTNDLQRTATALRSAADEGSTEMSTRRVRQLYLRLVRIFQADVRSFERKQFASLSHEANKAMNLNSYIGLMGGRYCVVSSPGGQVLVPAADRTPDLVVPNSDYVLTLDADSILLPEYCLRLAYLMEQKENADVAVAQTPYSSYRDPASRIERVAGATTDLQHIVHQGLTRFSSTFWVGANAVIRKRALDELLEETDEAGFVVRRYIKDRTVIEDTESSIDLRARGWRLYNYPERLSYSATPPDFGALVIQRRRWANGGLVILPKLLRMLRHRAPGVRRIRVAELFLRTNYLASTSWASLGLLILLFYPFEGQLLSRFAIVTAAPYFWAMASDLKRLDYQRRDVFRIYGFNLLLLPVNMVGTIESIVQGIGGQKMAFARTPKVRDRTVAPLMFIVVPAFIAVWSAWTLRNDIANEAYIHGAFAAVNMLAMTYACVALVGPWPMVVDTWVSVRDFIYRPASAPAAAVASPHWSSVLYVGSSEPEEIQRGAPLAIALAANDRFVNAAPARTDDSDDGFEMDWLDRPRARYAGVRR
jgi:cellulose synthase/poly-beta-1,6-N-acetylglucosamine synthase-like glycosyltransferase